MDLHIHTVLSPCGGLDMGAPDIVSQALATGIDCIAITDHNSCGNAGAVMEAADNTPLVVLPGLEVQTQEDIHVLTIFPLLERAREFEAWLRQGFLAIPNEPDIFGEQIYLDRNNDILGEEPLLLVHGVQYPIDDVVAETHRRGGFAVLAHVDRPSFSYVAVLGEVPKHYPVEGVELSKNLSPKAAEEWRSRLEGHSLVRSSDSHSLDTLIKEHGSLMVLKEVSFEEVLMALQNRQGRRVLWPWGG